MRTTAHRSAIVTASALLAFAFPSFAQQPNRPPVAIPPADLASFVDGMMDIQLKRDDAAGATVLVMQDGHILLCQGYGSADLQRRLPVSCDQTLFRAGAISTVFIATAVMQQVEQGRLSLDSDIAPSLDFPLPARPDGPITLRHLLTHTAGFDALPPRSPARVFLRDFVRSTPPRISPTGAVPSFSPYGMALAAYLVERVTGDTFAHYAEEHIFQPLGMTHSTFLQPLPPELAPGLSQGYARSTQPPLPFEVVAPAFALSTTAGDVARFAQMLLHESPPGTPAVLQDASIQQLLSRQFSPAPAVPGIGLGLNEIWFNSLHFFGQSGDTDAFHSDFEIEPQHHLALFLAYNSTGGDKLVRFSRGELLHGILDRYFPYHPVVKGIAPTEADRKAVTGTWLPTSDPQSNRLAIQSLFHQLHAHVEPAGGTLMIDEFVSDRGPIKHWTLIAPNVWQQYPQDRIVALPGPSPAADRLALAATPAIELRRVLWFENARLLIPALCLSLIGLVLMLPLLWRHRRTPGAATPASLATILFLGFLVWFALHFHLL